MRTTLGQAGLRFEDSLAEEGFYESFFLGYTKLTRVMLVAGVLLIFLFYLWDDVIDPGRSGVTRTVRTFVLCPVGLVALALTFTRWWTKWGEVILTGALIATALGVIWILSFLDGGFEKGVAGIVLVVFTAFVAFRLRIVYYVAFSVTTLFAANVALVLDPTAGLQLFMVGNMFVVSSCFLGLVSAVLHEQAYRERFVWAQEVVQQREVAEDLLYSLLPSQIADRLRRGEGPIADSFGEVTIVFADLAGFTGLASRIGPRHLVETLNRLFSEFDALAARFGVEKIKTMGDAYMAISGLQQGHHERHAENAARLAVEMRKVVDILARDLDYPLGVRIGLHTGPVIAGVIGSQKPAYDCWGEAVNMASRLETTADVGQIHLSESAYWRLREVFDVRQRGESNLKGFGPTRTYELVVDA